MNHVLKHYAVNFFDVRIYFFQLRQDRIVPDVALNTSYKQTAKSETGK
jgi:hypothetical protein